MSSSNDSEDSDNSVPTSIDDNNDQNNNSSNITNNVLGHSAAPQREELATCDKDNEAVTAEAFHALKKEFAAMRKEQENLTLKIQVCY